MFLALGICPFQDLMCPVHFRGKPATAKPTAATPRTRTAPCAGQGTTSSPRLCRLLWRLVRVPVWPTRPRCLRQWWSKQPNRRSQRRRRVRTGGCVRVRRPTTSSASRATTSSRLARKSVSRRTPCRLQVYLGALRYIALVLLVWSLTPLVMKNVDINIQTCCFENNTNNHYFQYPIRYCHSHQECCTCH